MDDEGVALSIGMVIGGYDPVGRVWADVIRKVQSRVAPACGDSKDAINLNVVFHVPGPLLAPDYEGVRTGSFRRRDSHLMVQVAVPTELPDDPLGAVRDMLFAAISAAEAWATKRKISERLDIARAIARTATANP